MSINIGTIIDCAGAILSVSLLIANRLGSKYKISKAIIKYIKIIGEGNIVNILKDAENFYHGNNGQKKLYALKELKKCMPELSDRQAALIVEFVIDKVFK